MNHILKLLKLRVRQAEIRLARPSYHKDSKQALVRLNGELSYLVKEQAAYIGALEAVIEEKETAVQA
jgi:hypothetical protein